MDNGIDARGKACPIPVVMAKKEADRGNEDFTVFVDNRTAVENLTRFGKNSGFDTAVVEKEADDFSVRFIKPGGNAADVAIKRAARADGDGVNVAGSDGGGTGTAESQDIGVAGNGEADAAANAAHRKATWAIFIGREGIGEGDLELGSSLMKMYFFTLAEGGDTPDFVLFMNDGVKVPTGNEQAVEHLKALEARGTEVLVCGTCLNFYNLADKLKVGTVSNMYDIAGAMQAVDKVISL